MKKPNRKSFIQWLADKQTLYYVIYRVEGRRGYVTNGYVTNTTCSGAKQVLSFSKFLAELTYRWHYGLFPFSPFKRSRYSVIGVVSEEEAIAQAIKRTPWMAELFPKPENTLPSSK
jgi:hypothetical protein